MFTENMIKVGEYKNKLMVSVPRAVSILARVILFFSFAEEMRAQWIIKKKIFF